MSLNNYTLGELSSRLKSIPLYQNIKGSGVLKELDFFSDLDEKVLDEISDTVVISEFSEGDIICRHGMFDERFFILLSGSVKAVIPTVNEPKFELFELIPDLAKHFEGPADANYILVKIALARVEFMGIGSVDYEAHAF